MPEPDRHSFGRVVGLGLAGAGLAAIAGHQPWVGIDASDDQGRALADAVLTSGADVAESPVAGALALVVLASWGVLLVTRGRVRRLVAVLGVLAAVGLVVAVVSGASTVPDAVRTALGPGTDVEVGRGPWLWLAALGALVSVVATALAVRLAPRWPEMGTRYDAPSGDTGPAAATAVEDQSNLELWKSIEEGRDPTT